MFTKVHWGHVGALDETPYMYTRIQSIQSIREYSEYSGILEYYAFFEYYLSFNAR
jgi:hypothetical protein